MNRINLIVSSAYAAIISSIFVVVVTIWAELSPPLKEWLKGVTGHHWTTKSVFTALIFVVALVIFYFVKRGSEAARVQQWLTWLLAVVVLGSIAIGAFYTGHHFQMW